MTDKEQLKTVLLWDEDAFRWLYKTYYKALVSYGMHISGDRVSAEDSVQDLFSTMIERRPDFASIYSLRAYLYNTVRNASLDYLRHKQVETSYLQNMMLRNPEYIVDESGEEQLFREEFYRRLAEVINQLPPRQHELFLLYMDGKKNAEIAEMMNVSIETVKTHKKRALNAIKSKLGPQAVALIVTICGA